MHYSKLEITLQMKNERETIKNQNPPSVAVLEHLSGPGIGAETLLFDDKLNVWINEDRCLDVSNFEDAKPPNTSHDLIARLNRSGGTYRIEAIDKAPVWVNGRQVDAGDLIHKDIVEFGEKGPLSRFCLVDSSAHSRRYFSDICLDCWDYLHTSRKPILSRTRSAVSDGMRRLLINTTLFFRFGVITIMLIFGLIIHQQFKINDMQTQRLVAGQSRLENFAASLASTQEEAITVSHLAAVRNALSRDLSSNLRRLETLEEQTGATETIIVNSTQSVVFLQGAFSYRDK